MRRVPRLVLWALAGLVAIVMVSMVVDASVYAGKVHKGVTVAGCDLSGLDSEQAKAALAEYIDGAKDRSVTLVHEDKVWELSPDSIGLAIDLDAAVSAAIGATRDANLVVDQARKLRLYFRATDMPLAGSVDQAKLDEWIDKVAAEIDRPAVNASVAVQGSSVEAIPARDGFTVDRPALAEQLVDALCRVGSTELPVPVIVDEAVIRADDCVSAIAQTEKMVSGPLTLTSLQESWTLSAAQIAQLIDFKTESIDGVSTLVPFMSAEKLAPTFKRLSVLMSPTPKDACFAGDDEKAWVVPAVPGRVLKPEETLEAINSAVMKTTERTAEIAVDLTEPDFTTEDAEALGISDLLSVRTTEWVGTKNRQNNVRITTEFIDQGGKRYLAPDEEFSFSDAVGPRTAERGYLLAPGIQPDGELDSELGGGICQVATTLFNSAFFAGLEITERRNHTIYISHYPQGRDAAVTTDEVDLRFVNDTDHYIWIKGESNGIRTTFWIYGTSDGREVTFRNSGIYAQSSPPSLWTRVDPSLPPGKTVVVSEGQPYMKVKITRWTKWPDGTVEEDVFLSVYPKRPKIVRVGPDT